MGDNIKLTKFSKGGGCGCKIAPSVLQQILKTNSTAPVFKDLIVGNETADDAAVYQINNETAIISTTDFFLPIVDDAYDFGRIAAANAVSDIYAMGAKPLMAIAILGFPVDHLPIETAQQILEGGRAICKEANIPLAGGHTIDSSEPIFGLAVTGTIEIKNLKKNNTAQEGDLIFLTKPIGTGILATALKKELLQDDHYTVLIKQLTQLNSIGEKFGKLNKLHAMTDVTGFGLLGHLIEIAEGSSVSIELFYNQIKKMDGLDVYLQQKSIPDASFRNWNSYSKKVEFEKGVSVMEAFSLLPDPQTNGGLLFSVNPDALHLIQDLLKANDYNDFLQPIGVCTSKKEKTISVKNI
jgi:selenide, water dikinase